MCNPIQCRYLAQASHLVLSLASNGVIRGASPDMAKTLGHPAATLTRKRLADLLVPRQRRSLGRILDRCRTNLTAWEELELLAADGSRVALLCCFQRLATPGDRGDLLLTGVRLGGPRDGHRLETAAVLGQIAFRCHSPAHRLMEAVEGVLTQYPRCKTAGRCRTELDRLLEVLSESVLLSPTGPEHDPSAGPAPPVDVVRTLETALRLVDGDAAYEDLEVSLRPDRSAVWAAAHPAGLVFVTLHLVRNARDATLGRKAPRLAIDVFLDGDDVILEFSDNGPGLPHEDAGCVFSPCAKTGSDEDGHSGLGLATCCELVRGMGGRMRLQSVPSKGTTVVVTLPAAAPPQ
jgi:signal transduction histidine kinase